MFQWRNRRNLIQARPKYTRWVPNMHVQEEFTKRGTDTAYYKKRTLDPIGKVPVQASPFYTGIVQTYMD